MIEPDYPFGCPYCAAGNSVRLDVSGGSDQSFVQDCTICCRPIQITVQFEKDQIAEFSAEQLD